MYFTPLFVLLFLALAAYGQPQEQKRVAILRTVDDGSPEIEPTELMHLTARLREIASNVLQNRYGIMTEQTIIDKLGGIDNAKNACKEAEGCLAKLGVKLNADYIGQARLGRFGGNLTISVELYNSGNSLAIHTISGNAKDVFGLLAVINEKAPEMFRKMPGVSSGSTSPSVAGGIGGVQVKGTDYEFAGEKRYLANISSDPEGASLSFNGVPDTRCKTTPCSVELGEGSVRIIAALEQYEMADTTVSIKQNNQSIRIRMKANFGVLEIKPAYSDGIGKDERWNLTINGKAVSAWENRLSPNKYKVELSHRCYEDLSFDVGINRDKREVFDMASYVKLKKGGLVLNAERDGKPVSEVVFVNGVQVGETPFSGSVAVCARVEIGSGRERVDVNLKHNEKVVHTVKGSSYKSAVSANQMTASKEVLSIITETHPNARITLGNYDVEKEFFEIEVQDTTNVKSPFHFVGKVEIPRDVAKSMNRSTEGFLVAVSYLNYPFVSGDSSFNLAMKGLAISRKAVSLKVFGGFKPLGRFELMKGYRQWRTHADSLLNGTLKPQGLNYALSNKQQQLTATQNEAQKKLNALNSRTISVYKDARGTIISISDVLFEFGKAELKQELKENLVEICGILKNLLTDATVIVEGHTDNVGKPDVNKKLSQQRANEVLNYLAGRGIDKKRLKSVGYGATRPVADNVTDEGKAKNRRVEIVIRDG
ncbi:MAG: OmpA family protein [Fibromonadales bacterium]|nr:OmpA family protein [Fibromonadales bacterium]